MLRAVLMTSLLFLAGCMDVDMLFDFTGRNSGTTTAEMRMTRETFDMLEADTQEMCEGGTPTLNDTEFRCVVTASGTIDDMVTGAGDFELEDGISVERVGSDRVRVTVDFAVLTKDAQSGATAPELRDLLVGHSFAFRVRGASVVETTGEISKDGTTASMTIPLEELLDPATAPKGAFVTVVQLP